MGIKGACAVILGLVLAALLPHDRPRRARFERSGAELVAAAASWSARVSERGELVVAATAGTPLSLRTRWLARGSERWEHAERPVLGADGVVRIARGVATETLAQTQAGVAQRWRFEAAPPGGGDLLVAVEALGGAGARDAGGVRFGAVRYGAATWVDAGGRATPLEQRLEGDAIVMRVPERVLRESRYPAVLDPVVGPEIGVDAPVFEAQEGTQVEPAVAFDGTNYLVAWLDYQDQEVVFARVGADGTPIDELARPLPAAFYGAPDVIYDGTQFVVVWAANNEVFACRVASDGTILDDPARSLHAGGFFDSLSDARIAHGAGRFFVTTQAFGQIGAPWARGYLLDDALQLVAGPTDLDGSGLFTGPAEITFDGARFVAVWQGWDGFAAVGQVGGVHVEPSDMAQAPFSAFVSLTGAMFVPRPAVAPVTGGVLVAWQDMRGSSVDLYARRVLPDGTLEPEALVAAGAADETGPVLLPTAGTALLAYRDADGSPCGLCARPLSNTGVAGAAVAAAPDGVEAAIDGGSAGALLAWRADGDVFVEAIGGAGAPASVPVIMSRQANAQEAPQLVRGARDNLALWVDDRSGAPEIMATALDAAGAPLAPAFAVAPSFAAARPAAASDGTSWLVAWLEGGQTHAAALPPLATPALAASSPPFGAPTLAHDGDSYLLLSEFGTGLCRGVCVTFDYVEVARLGPDGALLEALGPLNSDDNARHARAVGVDGAALVVWESAGPFGAEEDVLGRLIPHGELPGDPFVIGGALGAQTEPALAFGPGVALVVWQDAHDGGAEIRGARVGADGTVLDAEPLAISDAIASFHPDVAWTDDGYSFLVVWEGSAAGAPPEIYGAWVTLEGEVLDFPGVQLTDDGGAALPRVAAQGQGEVLLAYQRRVRELHETRVLTRVVSSGGLDGAACAADGECASRVCEDGACCPAACGSCETCNGETPGTCTPVRGADDDTCFGAVTCDAEGACKAAPGQSCQDAAECASGFCVDGLCCDQACDGTCDTCALTPGTCVAQDCGAYSCGEDRSCLTSCEDSSDCAAGFQCSAERTCGPAQTPSVAVDQGCACRSAARAPSPSPLHLALAALMVLGRARRRLRPTRARGGRGEVRLRSATVARGCVDCRAQGSRRARSADTSCTFVSCMRDTST